VWIWEGYTPGHRYSYVHVTSIQVKLRTPRTLLINAILTLINAILTPCALGVRAATCKVATKNTNIDGEGKPHAVNEDVQLVLTFNIEIQPLARTQLAGRPHLYFRMEVKGINIARKKTGTTASSSDKEASSTPSQASASQALAEHMKSKDMPRQEALLRNLQVVAILTDTTHRLAVFRCSLFY